ncbi:MAG: hypothetical protein ACXVBE_12365 [Bdellovibrionota bacterium]
MPRTMIRELLGVDITAGVDIMAIAIVAFAVSASADRSSSGEANLKVAAAQNLYLAHKLSKR